MEKYLKEIIEQNKLLIKLSAIRAFEGRNQTEKIMLLFSSGAAQKDIANILGIKLNTVTSVVSQAQKKAKKKGAIK